MQAHLTRALASIAATFALVLSIPALPALAAWPPDVAAADRALANAASFRVTTTVGAAVNVFVVSGVDRQRFTLPANAVAYREGDGSDGRRAGAPLPHHLSERIAADSLVRPACPTGACTASCAARATA